MWPFSFVSNHLQLDGWELASYQEGSKKRESATRITRRNQTYVTQFFEP